MIQITLKKNRSIAVNERNSSWISKDSIERPGNDLIDSGSHCQCHYILIRVFSTDSNGGIEIRSST